MPSIVTKRIHGKEYLYLVESMRVDDKIVQKTLKYVGKKRPIRKEEFECMKYSANRQDWVLNGFHEMLSYQDHAAMKKASETNEKYLKDLDQISREKEKEKFLSKFISNSNAIEGSTLTPKETHDYLFSDAVPKGHTKKELFMASNLLNAWEYMEKRAQQFLSEEDLKELHRQVNLGIESNETLGNYKHVQNYVGDVYTTSYLYVEERIKELLLWILKAFKEIDDFEVIFQSHAQFEIIHPFIDGNGRVGRLLMNWLLLHKGYSPIAIEIKKRTDYISAINNAQKGALKAICVFCYNEYADQYGDVVVN